MKTPKRSPVHCVSLLALTVVFQCVAHAETHRGKDDAPALVIPATKTESTTKSLSTVGNRTIALKPSTRLEKTDTSTTSETQRTKQILRLLTQAPEGATSATVSLGPWFSLPMRAGWIDSHLRDRVVWGVPEPIGRMMGVSPRGTTQTIGSYACKIRAAGDDSGAIDFRVMASLLHCHIGTEWNVSLLDSEDFIIAQGSYTCELITLDRPRRYILTIPTTTVRGKKLSDARRVVLTGTMKSRVTYTGGEPYRVRE